jgi:hypothetical protein
MKPNYLFLLIISFFTFSALTSCDKDDDPGVSREELLTSKVWQGNAVFATGIDITDNPELLNTFPDIRTLTLKFETDGTYTAEYIENNSPVTQVGEWEFRENQTVLYFDLMAAYKLKIGELNSKRMILTTNIEYESVTVPADVRFLSE